MPKGQARPTAAAKAMLRRAIAGAAMVATILAASPVAVRAATAEIDTAGPLTRVIVSDVLNCQVAHSADASLEVFGDETGACGTFLSTGGTLYGPSEIPSGSFSGTPWSPVSQTGVSGAGTRGDPFRIVTVVEAAGTGIRLEQTDSYVVGSQSYRTDVQLVSSAAQPVSGILYRAADCPSRVAAGMSRANTPTSGRRSTPSAPSTTRVCATRRSTTAQG